MRGPPTTRLMLLLLLLLLHCPIRLLQPGFTKTGRRA
jgi:hypothetical protein